MSATAEPSSLIVRAVFQSHPTVNAWISCCSHGPSGLDAIAIIWTIGWLSEEGVPLWKGQPGLPCGGVKPFEQLVQTAFAKDEAL
jgi:hypothetical protein